MPVQLTVPLYKVLGMSSPVKERAKRVASLLNTSSLSKTIVQVPSEDLEIFRYRWAEEFKQLADEITRSMV